MKYKTSQQKRDKVKIYNSENKEKILLYKKQYREKNKEMISLKKRIYAKNNLKKLALYRRNKIKMDIQFRLAVRLRNRMGNAFVRNSKQGSAVKDLGCSVKELKFYLEGKFEDGMGWSNYGQWEIDHVIPLTFFDLTNREQFLRACHYTNLQPMWAQENRIKSNRLSRLSTGKSTKLASLAS